MADARSLLDKIETVPVEQLSLYPGNPRVGDVPAIAASLRENAQYQPLVVQKSTGHVLAGNHTLKAAQSLGWEKVAVVYVDVNDAQARKIVLSANRTSDLATYDDQALADMLAMLDDFDGTGWVPDDLDDLLASSGDMPVMPYSDTQAGYAESPEDLRQRMEHFSGAQPRAAFGVREAVLILPQPQYEQLQALIAEVKRGDGGEMTAGEAVLRGMRAAGAAIQDCPQPATECVTCAWHRTAMAPL